MVGKEVDQEIQLADGMNRIAIQGAQAFLEHESFGKLSPTERLSIAVAFTGVQVPNKPDGSTISLLFLGDKQSGPFGLSKISCW